MWDNGKNNETRQQVEPFFNNYKYVYNNKQQNRIRQSCV